jgi:hypothetical protein
MAWRIRGLLGAVALVMLTSCGVTEDEAVRLKEGQTLGEPSLGGLEYCSTLGCPEVVVRDESGQAVSVKQLLCMEVFFEYGRSPALCVLPEVCNRLDCIKEGGQCALFDGFPGQVKCIRD